MKIHNLSVIFIVIAIPIILIVSYYMSLQIDTINMQTSYNAKLLDSTKEAIEAFEINTTEWNSAYSETADSKRRDVLASINTFTTSFANNLGVGGTSKEYILSYMPAIAYTLYDGYYIYSPAETKVAITDSNGVGVVINEKVYKDNITGNYKSGEYSTKKADEGKILYKVDNGKTAMGQYDGTDFTLNAEDAKTEYKHILKPFASYSEKIGDAVINYTLDNYITIYGNIEDTDGDGQKDYVLKSGYLTATDKIKGANTPNSINNITFDGNDIKPETLSERIAYKNGTEITTGVYNYVYEASGNTKVYFDDDNPFVLSSSLEKTYVENLTTPLYKKCTVPRKNDGKDTYLKIYQNLVDGSWYTSDDQVNYTLTDIKGISGLSNNEKSDDYSAINYCVESYVFTEWFNGLSLTNDTDTCGYSHDNPFVISSINSTNDPESQDSDFYIHKRGIIKNVVESNLNQAITSYSRNSTGDYQLPKLTETDWDQILRNVSIVTFVQNIPIGMKYYNNYAIATSTANKEYVDPNEIYLNADGDHYYHMPYCKELTNTTNIMGYRSIDYAQKSYTVKDTDGITNKTKYYDKHSNGESANKECYYCLVQRSSYVKEGNTANTEKSKAYNTALTREKYVARMAKLPAEVEPGYYINVTTNPENKGTIYIKKNEEQQKYEGGSAVKKIEKTDEEITYTIYGERNDINVVGAEEKNAASTSLDNRASVQDNELNKREYYTTNDNISVTIERYANDGVYVRYSSKGGNPYYGAGKSDNFDGETFITSDLGTGYVNVKLNYEMNYTKGSDSEAEVWANINSYNNLTIVTKPIGITGKVRLMFTAGEKKYYSANTFNVSEGESIYCEIEGTDWYNEEWQVCILNVKNETIARGEVSYYTIRDAQGLKDFAEAVNGTKGPTSGANTKKENESSREFRLTDNISEVVDMAPIAGVDDKWFDGYFNGNGKTISVAKISTDTKYNCFGLFGWVGKKAKIYNLTIDSITVDLSSISNEENKEYKAGGLAGYNNGEILRVTVKDSKINGINNTGGIAGYNNGEILRVTVKDSKINGINNTGGIVGYNNSGTISECKNENNISGKLNVGGIVGYNNSGTISECENNGEIKGSTNESTGSRGNIGGIVGINKGNINSCSNSEKITGIYNVNSTSSPDEKNPNIDYFKNIDDEKITGVGGIAGRNHEGTIEQSCNISEICCNYNGGGICGINYNGNIKYCFNIGNVKINIEIKSWFSIININRIGGICGVCAGQNVIGCYNKGEIQGKDCAGYNKYISGVGGIIGVLLYNKNGNKISYCYNVGNVEGDNTLAGDETHTKGAIIGTKTDKTNETNIITCYFLNSSDSIKGIGNASNENIIGKDINNLKESLYTWANTLIVSDKEDESIKGKYIYNTIAPVEENKGYQGYGVLWWQLKNYVRLKTYIASNSGLNRLTKVVDGSETTLKIGEKAIILNDQNNIKNYNNELDLHCWVCYISNDNDTTIKAKANYYDDSEERTINANTNTDMQELLVLEGKSASVKLNPSGDATLNWERTRLFSRKCEKNMYYRTVWGVRTLRKTEWSDTQVQVTGRWNAEGQGGLKKTLSKSSLLNEDGEFGYVMLKGDGYRKFNLDDYKITVNTYEANGTFGKYEFSKDSKETISGETENVSGVNAGVKITVPIENIITKTSTNELPFNRNSSKITYGKAVVNLVYFHYEGKYNGPGASPNDPISINVKFGNQDSTVQKSNLRWEWFSNKTNYHEESFEFEFKETNEIPESITVDIEWGADIESMYFGIDSAYVDVSYKQ